MSARALAAAIAVLGLSLPPAAAKDAWIRVRTGHLDIISNAGERATRTLAERLERFVDGVSALAGERVDPAVPVTVMVFRNDASFAPFRPRQNGRTMNVAGYFQRADDENLIALSLETIGGENQFRVIFHEYAHALTARAAALWPPWLQEGLAEFYAAFQSDSRRFVVGEPLLDHVRLIRERGALRARDLFAADRQSAAYGADQDDFYAASWLLTHYAMVGDLGRRRAAFDAFVSKVAAGIAPDRAFLDAFQTDFDTLDAELRRYVAEGRYAGATMAAAQPARAVVSTAQPVAEADAEVALGNLLMRVGRGDEADAHFARAAALDPHAPRLEESLGFLTLNRRQYDAAAAHLQQAIAQDPRNALAHYYYAETLRRRVMEQGLRVTPAIARSTMAPLERVITLNPSFARAHYLLGHAHSVAGDDLSAGARHLQTAIQLAPPHRAAMLTLASVQLRMGDDAAARSTVDAILTSWDASEAIKAEARRLMDVR